MKSQSNFYNRKHTNNMPKFILGSHTLEQLIKWSFLKCFMVNWCIQIIVLDLSSVWLPLVIMLFIAANSSPAPKGRHLLIETEDDNETDFKKEVNILL